MESIVLQHVTTDQDLTYVDTLSVTAIAGNGTNGGLTPINGLDVYFIGDEEFAGPFNVAPAAIIICK